jgi:hypothetical protein
MVRSLAVFEAVALLPRLPLAGQQDQGVNADPLADRQGNAQADGDAEGAL